ncbi:Macrocin-O-methyltransferase (TylF) [Thiovulum sp. ES]|nr:Macrocin-O-methyltransferase (TylF) [Thiovulum sp. ES]
MDKNIYETSTLAQGELNKILSSANIFDNSTFSTEVKLQNFTKYVRRQDLTYFLTKYEIFKKIVNIHGSIVECGVLYGGSLMTWANLSSILEPINHNRKIIGFDTFEGFQSVSENDNNKSTILQNDGMKINDLAELRSVIENYDNNRFLSHIEKVELVKGDITVTGEEYLKSNPHLVISLLYLDCDIYKPTKTALELFIPRMPKGSIIVFDELNTKSWPGETLAVLESFGLNNLKIERFSFDTNISYAVIS